MKELSIAYECINSIGNSLNLEEMLEDIIGTFVNQTSAIGGKYINLNPAYSKNIIHIGSDFPVPLKLLSKKDSFMIHTLDNSSKLLDLFIHDGHFLFAFNQNNDIEALGEMFVNFSTKITNAIEACYNVEKVQKLNQNLKAQISEEKNKNAFNEKLIISQSRMAIMGEMIGMIAHQWRQPITIIGMVTNNMVIDLHLDNFDKERAIKELEAVDKQVHYLSRTIDDFRNFFKPNKLAQTISFETICNELKTMLGKSFETHNIELIFEGEKNIQVTTFKNELIQVLLNVLTNAKDAFSGNITDNAFIKVTVKQLARGDVSIFVHDNAGGISPDIINKIFDPYFSTKHEKNGTGLGLYMSAMILEKHLGGSILVSSDMQESIFHIRFRSIEEKKSVY
ncbi:sensor histidine kinase [Sulfurimonas marina]|uniref:histidine kinase n=1 Tax=Sulfurimonas marina TaxID=2590551 RepID=A0A7M3V9E0_9BACT|nr:HAMP domain-containing sensor histidine kinase [Sulfurimonas marina]QOP40373.1 HAMP domain-containing histidine kinase [Sulfurimonas marina]